MRRAIVRSPIEAFELWSTLTKQQLHRFSEQYEELTALGQKLAAGGAWQLGMFDSARLFDPSRAKDRVQNN